MAELDHQPSNRYIRSTFPLFHQVLQAHFPGALPLEDYMQQTCRHLKQFGFDSQNALGIVAVCRDEIADPLLEAVIKYWGNSFDGRSLAGFVLMGRSGVATAITHTPIVDGIRRFVFYAMAHIAISKDGEIGTVYRDSIQQASHACGSLSTVLSELESGRLNLETDLDDIEQCSVRQKILSAIHYGDKLDLHGLTDLACRIISNDVKRLLSSVDSATFNYAVLTGILIHGPRDTQWIYPQNCYVVGAKSVPGGSAVIEAFHKGSS